jgi:hypothetical protein
MNNNYDLNPEDEMYFAKSLTVGINKNKNQLKKIIKNRKKIIILSSALTGIIASFITFQFFSFKNSIEIKNTLNNLEIIQPSKRSATIAKRIAEKQTNNFIQKTILTTLPIGLISTFITYGGLWLLILHPSIKEQQVIQDCINQLILDYKTIELDKIPLDDLAKKISELEGVNHTSQEVKKLIKN